jgi:hypothetical protein
LDFGWGHRHRCEPDDDVAPTLVGDGIPDEHGRRRRVARRALLLSVTVGAAVSISQRSCVAELALRDITVRNNGDRQVLLAIPLSFR